MKKKYVSKLKDKEFVESVFSVKYKHKPKDYNNKEGQWFRVGLADKTGEIDLYYWGGPDKEKTKKIYESFDVEDILYVRGYVKEDSRRKKLKINVNEDSGILRKAKEDEYELSYFLYETNQDIDKMFNYLTSYIEKIENEFLKKLLDHFFQDEKFVKKLKNSPAAMYMHHGCVGGLLEHTWGVLKICNTINKIHPSLDKDLLITGAILHDIGKIKEFKTTSNIKITEEGMLMSHVFLGTEMVSKVIDKIPEFPKNLKNKIKHIILSHHGELEYGALKRPQFPEAATIYYADLTDSQITQYIRIKKDTKDNTEDFRTYSKYLGEIYLR